MRKNVLNSLCGTYEKVARAIAARHDIRVVPSTMCATDGRTIYFPANADHLSDATREVLAGLNDHEVGHICEEDKHKLAGKRTPMEYLHAAGTNKERMLMNVYEDIHMEVFQALSLVGVAENLAALSSYSTQHIDERVNAPGFNNFWYAIGCAIINASHGEDMSWLPMSYRPYVDAIVEEIAESSDTDKTVWAEDCWDLVQRTLVKLDEVAEELHEETEHRTNVKADEKTEEDGEGGAYSKMGDDDLSDAIDLAEDMDEDALANDLLDEVKNDINVEAERIRTVSESYSVSPEAMRGDRWITPIGNKAEFDYAKHEVAKQIRGMKGKMLNLIKTQAEATLVGDQDQGDLDPDAFYSVKTGNRKIFTQTVEGVVLDTVVSILVDQSGSMGQGSSRSKGRSYYAKLMTIALAETFNALNIPFEVIGFHNDFRSVGPDDRSARANPFEFQVYKAFDEKYRKVQTRLGSITGYEENADGEAVFEVAKRLAVRDEKRKIMFVLSDGLPRIGRTYVSLLTSHLKGMVAHVTAAGIEVIGIGAQTESVREFYNAGTGSSCIVIHDIDMLAVEVYKTMRSMVLNKGHKKRGRRRAG